MNSKTLNIVLGILLVSALAFSFYSNSHSTKMKGEVENWEKKYEEALIDMEEAYKRLEDKDKELKNALEEAKKQKQIAEESLKELQKSKGRK